MPVLKFSFSGRSTKGPFEEFRTRRVQVHTHVTDLRHAEQIFNDWLIISGFEKEEGTDVKAKFVPEVVA
jgi:hypothetical protein